MTTYNLEQWLKQHNNKDVLRFLTCGSVDDGKSTLIGRLLYDSKKIYQDQIDTLIKESEKIGNAGNQIDFSLLVDGLAAEREQGITIDIAWRYFNTEKRNFVIVDCPGHEQYTRNMATGASHCQLAIVLIDARNGVKEQTKRHSYICNLLGINQIIVAVNKMDLVDYSQQTFNDIVNDYKEITNNLYRLKGQQYHFLPMSALQGDNVTEKSSKTPWYEGGTLMQLLETANTSDISEQRAFRMPIQYVNRPDINFRGYCGEVISGTVQIGDKIMVLPSEHQSEVASITTFDGGMKQASKGDAITLTLNTEIDISRGDIICTIDNAPSRGKLFKAHIVWMDSSPLKYNQSYLFRIGTKEVYGKINKLVELIDVNTLKSRSDRSVIALNDIALVEIELEERVALDSYASSKQMGSFLMINRLTNATSGIGMVRRILRSEEGAKATNVYWSNFKVDKAKRADLKGQKPCVLWFTGLSGSGKSTIANLVEQKLFDLGVHTMLLDGDNLRHGLNKNLGFSERDRIENIRVVSEVSKLMVDAGLVVLVSLISPFKNDRNLARSLFENDEFYEVYINTPIEVCAERDPKGLYKKAKSDEIKNFTGVDSPYEPPAHPEIHIDTTKIEPDKAAEQIIKKLGL
jgi:bifunctional enzyme CysN/CysC